LSGEAVVRFSIWLSLGAWGLAEWLRLRPSRATPDPAARAAWALGVGFAIVHVLAAFEVHHGWSHAAAVASTARQTEEALGRSVGTGVYLNYLFVGVWTLDVLWWWLSPASFGARLRALDTTVRLFLLFMFVNGAIVFARGPIRPVATALVAALAVAWYRRREVARVGTRA
jgi:hypothetical protein